MNYMCRLFKAEMRLNHNMRQTEKSVLAINEIRTGVVHIASLLSANDDLLQNLPQSTPPVMKSDAGIVKMLAWCEERVLAINEALVLDASKPAGIDDTKPLHARQTELASLVQGMIHRDESNAARLNKRKMRNLKKDSMSKTLLATPEGTCRTDWTIYNLILLLCRSQSSRVRSRRCCASGGRLRHRKALR
jgi:hypothetical protein